MQSAPEDSRPPSRARCASKGASLSFATGELYWQARSWFLPRSPSSRAIKGAQRRHGQERDDCAEMKMAIAVGQYDPRISHRGLQTLERVVRAQDRDGRAVQG